MTYCGAWRAIHRGSHHLRTSDGRRVGSRSTRCRGSWRRWEFSDQAGPANLLMETRTETYRNLGKALGTGRISFAFVLISCWASSRFGRPPVDPIPAGGRALSKRDKQPASRAEPGRHQGVRQGNRELVRLGRRMRSARSWFVVILALLATPMTSEALRTFRRAGKVEPRSWCSPYLSPLSFLAARWPVGVATVASRTSPGHSQGRGARGRR